MSQPTSHALSLALTLAAGAAIASPCAWSERAIASPTENHQPPAPPSATQELRRLAERQAASPDPRAMRAGAPPGIEASALVSLPPAQLAPGAPAVRPLNEVLRGLDTRPTLQSHEDPPAHVITTDAADHVEALRLYTAAKLAMLDTKPAEALQAFETASRLDPTALDIFREIGLLQRRLGKRSAAMAALRTAATLGMDDAIALWTLAREETRSENTDAALSLLVLAHSNLSRTSDPGVHLVVGVDLSTLLSSRGFIAASAECLEQSLLLAPSEAVASLVAAEAADVLRRRGELWLTAGDLRTRVGDTDAALRDYDRAGAMPNFDPAGLRARRTHALLSRGHSARAALDFLSALRAAPGAIDPAAIALAEFLTEQTNAGTELPSAIEELAGAAASLTPSDRSRYALLASAVAPDTDAKEAILLRACERVPLHRAVVLALLDLPAQNDEQVLARANAVLEHDPLGAGLVADAILARGVRFSGLFRLVCDSSHAPHDALELELKARIGNTQEHGGGDFVDIKPFAASDPHDLSRVRLQASGGHIAGARGLADSLLSHRASAEPSTHHVAMLAYDATGQWHSSLAAFDDLRTKFPDAVTIDDLLLAGELCVRLGKPSDAKQWWTMARQRDPRDERTYEPLIVLHLPSGALPDSAALLDVVRAVRQELPGASLVRIMLAQDQILRGGFKQAVPALRAMIDDRGEPVRALALLAECYEQAAKDDHALAQEGAAWLGGLLAARPDSATLALALTRVQVALGQSDDAHALLVALSARVPVESLARQREFVLRAGLGKADEADALALERLAPKASSEAALLELIPIHVRRAEFDRATEALRALLPEGTKPAPAVAQLLIKSVTGLDPRAVARSGERACDEAAAFLELLASRSVMEKRAALAASLDVYLRSCPESGGAIVRTITLLSGGDEEVQSQTFVSVARELLRREDPTALLRLLGAAVEEKPADREHIAGEWLVRTAAQGNAEDLRWLVSKIEAERMGPAVLARMVPGERLLHNDDAWKAEVAYSAGNLAQNFGREQLAVDAYRMALGQKPEHAWAANNLGYLILERGGSLEEANTLIERAIAALPREASVIDSLAWARYKQGKFRGDAENARALRAEFDADADGPEPAGPRGHNRNGAELNADLNAEQHAKPDAKLAEHMLSAGAVELLELASRTPAGSSNAELFDHLGDARWRADDKPRAIEAWKLAKGLYAEEAQLAAQVQLVSPQSKLMLEALHRVEAKIGATGANKEPTIAEPGISAVFTPSPEPPPIRFRGEDLGAVEAVPAPRVRILDN